VIIVRTVDNTDNIAQMTHYDDFVIKFR